MFIIVIIIQEIMYFNADSVDLDQIPHSVASDLDLYCLLMSLYGTLSINVLKMNGQRIRCYFYYVGQSSFA